MDNIYGAVIMTQVIVRVHPVHLTNADHQRQTAANPQTRPTYLGCESACRLLAYKGYISPFIITQPESRYSFYHPTEGERLSRPRHPARVAPATLHTGVRNLPKVFTRQRPGQESNLAYTMS